MEIGDKNRLVCDLEKRFDSFIILLSLVIKSFTFPLVCTGRKEYIADIFDIMYKNSNFIIPGILRDILGKQRFYQIEKKENNNTN